MARTLDPKLHAVRRDAFLDVAQRLVQAKGYEAMSIQDVLDELGASRGAFYHYFDSKVELLEQLVERFAEGALAALEPVLADPELEAPRKLERIFGSIASWKAQRRDLVLAIMEVWASDGNAILREKLRRMTQARLEPLLAAVIRQGVDEGHFAGEPEESAVALVALMLGFQERAVDLFLARQANRVGYELVVQNVSAFGRAYERVLGARPGSLSLTDEATLRFWFG